MIRSGILVTFVMLIVTGVGCSSAGKYMIVGADTLVTTAPHEWIGPIQQEAYYSCGKYSPVKPGNKTDHSYYAKSKRSETKKSGSSTWVAQGELGFEIASAGVVRIKEVGGNTIPTVLSISGENRAGVMEILSKIAQELEKRGVKRVDRL